MCHRKLSLESDLLCKLYHNFFLPSSTTIKITRVDKFSSVSQLRPTLCNPLDYSTQDLPVHHQLPGFSQTHVHRVDDAIQPSHPLSSPSSSHLQSFLASGSFPMSRLLTSGGQSIGVSASTSVLPVNIPLG